MTGWRIGYIGAPSWIAKSCTKFQGQITSGANAIGQRATIAALQAPVDRIRFMIDTFHQRRDLILQLLGEIEGFRLNVPEGAFYVFPSIKSTGQSSIDFAQSLLKKQKVALVPGVAFGKSCEGYVRISYASAYESLKEAVRRIGTYLGK